MTREEAIALLKALKNGLHETGKDFPYRDEVIPPSKEALDMAIKELEQDPTTKNDLVVDWESYKDVDGNSLDDLILDVIQRNFDCGNTYGYKVADEIIGLLPSVTPQEPRKGQWCPQNDDYFDWYECSECGYGSEGEMQYSSEFDVRTNFCPNCGADMREGEE